MEQSMSNDVYCLTINTDRALYTAIISSNELKTLLKIPANFLYLQCVVQRPHFLSVPFNLKQLHIYAADKKNTSIFMKNLRILPLFDHPNDLPFFLNNKKSSIKYRNYVKITQQDFDLTSKCSIFIIVIYFCVGLTKNTSRLVVDTYISTLQDYENSQYCFRYHFIWLHSMGHLFNE